MTYQLTAGGGEAAYNKDKGTANAVQGFTNTQITVGKNVTALPFYFEFEASDGAASFAKNLVTQAWIKISGVWKQATVWIKVAGTWKAATPKIKVSGVWK